MCVEVIKKGNTKMDKDLIVIDRNEIARFVEQGGKLAIKPEAELHLVRLLELQEMVEKAIEDVKEKIVEAGKNIDPDFKGVIGRRIKAIYRHTQSPYDFDAGHTEEVMQFLKETKYYRVDGAKVEEYIAEKGVMPDFILEKEREKSLIISLKDEVYDE